MNAGKALTFALGIAILAMLALTVVPAQQDAAPRPGRPALTTLDYIEIQQLVRRSAWALDSGDNYGYAYADLFVPDGVFVGTNQGANGRTFDGRDQIATIARGGTRGHTVQRHFTMNHLITPTADGATGRAYVVVLDLGIAGRPNRVNHGGHYDDIYERTPQGWRFKRRTYYESAVDVWPDGVPKPGQGE